MASGNENAGELVVSTGSGAPFTTIDETVFLTHA